MLLIIYDLWYNKIDVIDNINQINQAIEFDFVVARVQSMADGSPRLILDLPEDAQPAVMMLWEAKLQNIPLHAIVTVSPI